MTRIAPNKVLRVGSPQIKNPNIIAKTSAKYFSKVTKIIECHKTDSAKFAIPPKIPIKDNKTKSLYQA